MLQLLLLLLLLLLMRVERSNSSVLLGKHESRESQDIRVARSRKQVHRASDQEDAIFKLQNSQGEPVLGKQRAIGENWRFRWNLNKRDCIESPFLSKLLEERNCYFVLAFSRLAVISTVNPRIFAPNRLLGTSVVFGVFGKPRAISSR